MRSNQTVKVCLFLTRKGKYFFHVLSGFHYACSCTKIRWRLSSISGYTLLFNPNRIEIQPTEMEINRIAIRAAMLCQRPPNGSGHRHGVPSGASPPAHHAPARYADRPRLAWECAHSAPCRLRKMAQAPARPPIRASSACLRADRSAKLTGKRWQTFVPTRQSHSQACHTLCHHNAVLGQQSPNLVDQHHALTSRARTRCKVGTACASSLRWAQNACSADLPPHKWFRHHCRRSCRSGFANCGAHSAMTSPLPTHAKSPHARVSSPRRRSPSTPESWTPAAHGKPL